MLLLLASLVFYSWGEPVYVVLMVASIAANWAFGLAAGSHAQRIGKAEVGMHLPDNRRKWILVLAVVFNVLVIGFFKYEGFLAGIVNDAVGIALLPNLELPLPIGISFYTLQALSYVIDAYRGRVQPQRNPLYLGGPYRLHLPGLLRLQRLLRHGHRPRAHDGLFLPAQLQLSLHR